jgi:outer membrane protein
MSRPRRQLLCAGVMTAAMTCASGAGAGMGLADAQTVAAVDLQAAAAAAVAGTDAAASSPGGAAPVTALAPQTPPAQTPPPVAPTPGPQSSAMTTAPVLKVTFKEAVDRALQRNPSVAQATSEILRANALLRQARAALFPTVNGSLQDTVASQIIEFDGSPISPRNSFTATAPVTMPLSAVSWARRNQAKDNTVTADRALVDARRQIAQSAAQAYLAIILQRRQVDAAVRARDTAKAHYDLAHQQQVAGAGSRLNELRAQQELSADEVTLSNSELAVYQAQEALGVLLAADGSVDASEEPVLDLPPTPDTTDARVGERTDVRLAVAREMAAQRVFDDSWKDRLPNFQVQITPTFLHPSTLFSPRWTANTIFSSTLPVFDGGLRTAQKIERQALLQEAQSTVEATRRQAGSEIRSAMEAVKSAERSVVAARAAAEQANEVVNITNIAFRAGASTNIEVIDAQRAARDADTNAATQEDQLRRAKLDLLVATGRFPY